MVKVYMSSVIDARADSVWARIRDFNGLPQWHPVIADSRIENGQPADRVGCIRNFHLSDGGMIREQLLTLSDYDYSCTYSILESPMGVSNYVATLKLTPVTDGNAPSPNGARSSIATRAREARAGRAIGNGVFQGGFDALKRHFGALSSRMLQQRRPLDRHRRADRAVWAVLRDFNSHDRWHDVVAESRIEGGERSDQVGCVRSFR